MSRLKKDRMIPVFTIYKEGSTTLGPVTIMKQANDGNYNTYQKMKFYESLGYTVEGIDIKPKNN